MISEGINYNSNKNQVLSQIPDKKFNSKFRLGFRNDPISKKENPKYKLMGKNSFFQNLQMFKNINDKA